MPCNNSPLINTGIACLSSAAAESVIFPVDLVKTNMQVRNTSIKQSVNLIYKEGGIHRFYKGFQTAIFRHWIYTNLRVGFYRPVLNQYSSLINYNTTDKSSTPITLRFLAGATSGGLGQFIANPTDLLKVQMQTNRNATYTSIIQNIYQTSGIKGFYRGTVPNVQRAILVNAGELAAYDTAKQFLITNLHFEDNTLCFFSASVISGFFSSVLSCPADVVKSKLMSDTNNIYKGVLDCYVRTIRNDGFPAIYRGFIPTWMRLGPWHLIFWLTSENLRKAFGIETF